MSSAIDPLDEYGFDNDERSNPKRWGGVTLAGVLIIALFFGVFAVWAWLAPLGSGAIAQGNLQVDSNQKTVQHLEGGIVKSILVRDGMLVEQDQILLELEPTRSRMEVDLLEQQFLANKGAEARLLAERDEDDEILFPDALLNRTGDATVDEIIAGQRRLFANRMAARSSQVSLLRRRIGKSREEIAALNAQQDADRKQLGYIAEEIDAVRILYQKGLERKPRLLSLQRTAAQLEGSIGNRTALAARAEQTIAETEFQLVNIREKAASDVETELRRVQEQLADLVDRLAGAEDALFRTSIRAPAAGRVYGLRFHNEGGVVGPGEPILGIVPHADELVVEVQIDPQNIDEVRIGSPASVRLTSLSQRTTIPIDGILVYVSPDLIEEQGVPPHYLGRIVLDRESLEEQSGIQLLQGMPAMAVISTGDQTLFEYLVAPLARSFDHALREN